MAAQQQHTRSADQERVTDIVAQLVQRINALEARLHEAERACQHQPAIIEAVSLLRTDADKATAETRKVAQSADLLKERLDSTDGSASTLNDMISMHENVIAETQGQQMTLEERLDIVEVANGSPQD